jgi:hypothetical protein
VILPELFEQYPEVDVFFHDSLHTFELPYFEYTTAWPHLPTGGVLLSDDIFWSEALHRFSKENSVTYVRVGEFGGIKKQCATQ